MELVSGAYFLLRSDLLHNNSAAGWPWFDIFCKRLDIKFLCALNFVRLSVRWQVVLSCFSYLKKYLAITTNKCEQSPILKKIRAIVKTFSKLFFILSPKTNSRSLTNQNRLDIVLRLINGMKLSMWFHLLLVWFLFIKSTIIYSKKLFMNFARRLRINLQTNLQHWCHFLSPLPCLCFPILRYTLFGTKKTIPFPVLIYYSYCNLCTALRRGSWLVRGKAMEVIFGHYWSGGGSTKLEPERPKNIRRPSLVQFIVQYMKTGLHKQLVEAHSLT